MRILLLAFALGVALFAALEAVWALRYALHLEATILVDAASFGLAAAVLTLALKPLLLWAHGARIVVPAALFFALFGPLAGIFIGLLELTVLGGWDAADRVRSALLARPINLVVDTMIGLWFVAAPAILLIVLALARAARATGHARSAS